MDKQRLSTLTWSSATYSSPPTKTSCPTVTPHQLVPSTPSPLLSRELCLEWFGPSEWLASCLPLFLSVHLPHSTPAFIPKTQMQSYHSQAQEPSKAALCKANKMAASQPAMFASLPASWHPLVQPPRTPPSTSCPRPRQTHPGAIPSARRVLSSYHVVAILPSSWMCTPHASSESRLSVTWLQMPLSTETNKKDHSAFKPEFLGTLSSEVSMQYQCRDEGSGSQVWAVTIKSWALGCPSLWPAGHGVFFISQGFTVGKMLN